MRLIKTYENGRKKKQKTVNAKRSRQLPSGNKLFSFLRFLLLIMRVDSGITTIWVLVMGPRVLRLLGFADFDI